MKTKLFFVLAMILGISLGKADAQGRIHHNQKARIAQGVRSGQITGPEAQRLVREQRHIHRDVRRARMNDGHIGPMERRHIRHEKRMASRHIYRARHNRMHRF